MPQIPQDFFIRPLFADPIALDDSFAVYSTQTLQVSAPGLLRNDQAATGDDLDIILITDGADHGSLSVFSGGNFTYTPDFGFEGEDSFTYRVRDAFGNTAEATVTISVLSNPAPVALSETYSVMENQSLTVAVPKGLLLNDADPDDSDLSVVLISDSVDNGALSAFSGGNFNYTPDPGFIGEDSFSYRIRDEDGNAATATATINVIENAAPLAFDETFVVKEGETLSITQPGLLQNDLDPEGEDLSVSLITDSVDNGDLSAFSGGNFTYTPDPDFAGTDSFTYRIRDEGGGSAQATATIVVVPDLAPLARDETYALDAGGTLEVGALNGLLKNDVDPEGGDLSVVLITDSVDNGALSAFSGGNFRYTPDPGFVGTDSFTYRIRDDAGKPASATATIEVRANPEPEAFGEAYAVLRGGVLSIPVATGLLRNDLDADGGDLSVILITNSVDNGSLSAFSGGNFTYTPDPGFVGTDSFTYRVRDDSGNSVSATATIEVVAPPGLFLAANGFEFVGEGSFFVSADKGLLSNLSPRDDLKEQPRLIETVQRAPTQNGLLTTFEDGSFEYTPKAGFVGEDRIAFSFVNAFGQIEATSLAISIGNPDPAPVATNDSFTLFRDQTLTVDAIEGLLTNDFDPNGTDLTITLISDSVDNGSVSVFSGGNFTYTPNAGFVGTDSFTYRVREEDGTTSSATVEINVLAPAAPVATDDSYAVEPGTALVIDVAQGLLTNDYDQQGDDLSVVLITDSVDNGNLSVFSGGNFTYTPDPGFSGIDSFTYRIRDEDGAAATATVSLHVRENVAPVANPDRYTVLRNESLVVAAAQGLLQNDLDPEGAGLNVQLITDSVDNGDVSVFSGGNFTYTPDPGFVGTDSFTYRVRDDDGGTSQTTVTINVVAPTPPIATDDSYVVFENEVLVIDVDAGLLANDLDQTGQDLNVVVITDSVDNGALSVFSGGNFNYTPNVNFVGTDSFTYRIRDEDGGAAIATVAIEVLERPAPVALGDLYAATAGQTLEVSADAGLLVNDIDPSNSDLSVVLITDSVDNGSLSVFQDGRFNYTPDFGFSGIDSFTYRVRNEFGKSDDATVEIAVTNPLVFLPGSLGNDIFELSLDRELIDLTTGGNDVVRGRLDTLADATIRGFGRDDAILIDDFDFSFRDISIRSGSAIIGIDRDGDGQADTEVKLEGDYQDSTFYLEQFNGENRILVDVFEDYNEVRGKDRSDFVRGTKGNDLIDGGGGKFDWLHGRQGEDAFVFGGETSNGRTDRDYIKRFKAGEDLLLLRDTEITSIESKGWFFKRTEIRFEGDKDKLILLNNRLDMDDLRILYELGGPDDFLS